MVDYRNFGRTGVKVSPLCLGGMNFGGRTTPDEAATLVSVALEHGINFIDTANVYGHEPDNFREGRGRSEQIIGQTLKQLQRRDQVVLASKAYFPMGDDPNDSGSSRKHLIAQCEASLRRLNTDYLDLYQLHHPTNDVPIDETLRALDDLIRAGKIRYIGTSSFSAWQFVESLWVAKEYGLNRFVSEQAVYNLLDRRLERELIPMAQTYGIAIMVWSPTAGGFLTGKYQRDAAIPEDSRYDQFWSGGKARVFTPAAFDLVDVIRRIAQEHGCSPAQIALAWCLSRPGITSVIIGPRTVEQLQDNLGALTNPLSADDLAQLDQATPPGDKIVPFYGYDGFAWNTWGPHQFRW
ncbi:MAG: aldo/keto reductase [Anaerolineae bacterium]|nr:aldo/keto reductase [Anaerolineae bacterium]